MTVDDHGTALQRAEQRVEEHSAVFRKELGVKDLVLAQILTVVGGFGIGTAAKLGAPHLALWILAILLFFLPLASVVIYLNRIMPLEGGTYQWAKLGFQRVCGLLRRVEHLALRNRVYVRCRVERGYESLLRSGTRVQRGWPVANGLSQP